MDGPLMLEAWKGRKGLALTQSKQMGIMSVKFWDSAYHGGILQKSLIQDWSSFLEQQLPSLSCASLFSGQLAFQQRDQIVR